MLFLGRNNQGNQVLDGFCRLLCCFIVCFLLTQCSSSASISSNSDTDSDTASSSSGSTTSSVVGGTVSELSVSDGSAELTFDDLSDDENILLLLYSYSESSSSIAFEVGSSVNAALMADDPMYLALSGEEEVVDEDMSDPDAITEALHLQLRDWEEALDSEAALDSEGGDVRYSVLYASTGSSRTFKVLNSFSDSSSYSTVTATLRYQTDDFSFYVDDRDEDALDDADLADLASDFSDVLPVENSLFGTVTDVNGDGQFAVLFTHEVNSLGASSGGMVTGFFYAIDLFDADVYSVSNEMEVFYTFIPDPDADYGSAVSKSFAMSNIYPGVLPHEYQHMINFNQHYFVNSGAAESGWLNEGLSHLAEDIHSANADDYMEETGMENPARVSSFLSDVNNVCITCGTTLKQRGGSYLFIRYLYEQAELGNLTAVDSGAELLANLLDTNFRGTDNVTNAAFGSLGTSSDFKTIYGQFALATYLSNTGYSTNEQLGFTGINLRSVQDDNRGTVLNGPSILEQTSLPLTDTLSGVSATYVEISGETINDNGGTLSLSFGTGADFGGYAVRED